MSFHGNESNIQLVDYLLAMSASSGLQRSKTDSSNRHCELCCELREIVQIGNLVEQIHESRELITTDEPKTAKISTRILLPNCRRLTTLDSSTEKRGAQEKVFYFQLIAHPYP